MSFGITQSWTIRVLVLVLVVALVLTGRAVVALLVGVTLLGVRLAEVKATFYQKMLKRHRKNRRTVNNRRKK